ncbi:hypothetical protein B0T13DRAFT_491774 [Neurospora crassa]|nr:hypothetical protein B0T13DRAFT_491774 [Neurospora crassa]
MDGKLFLATTVSQDSRCTFPRERLCMGLLVVKWRRWTNQGSSAHARTLEGVAWLQQRASEPVSVSVFWTARGEPCIQTDRGEESRSPPLRYRPSSLHYNLPSRYHIPVACVPTLACVAAMPTLRERPSRGDSSPAKRNTTSSAAAPTRTAARTTPRTTRRQSSNINSNIMAAAPARDAIEVRESIEAKGDVDDDVDMEDADAKDDEPRKPTDKDQDADMAGDREDAEEEDHDQDEEDEEESDSAKDLLQLIRDTSEYLCRYTIKVDGEDYEIASGFQRLVNKRSLPDYFEVIKTPMAFSTIRGKLGKKSYTSFNEFVQDVTRICHNAQVYNRPSAPIFSDAGRLLEVFKGKLAELVRKGDITEKDAEIPDYGPLPEFEDSPTPEEEEDEEEEEEEEEESESDDSDAVDSDGRRRRGRRRGGRSRRRKQDDDDDEAQKKHTRPLKVLTPQEARIQALLKGLRKFKNENGHVRINHFQRLPDKSESPGYYAAVRNPIALDMIIRKHKRKKYQYLDQVLQDLELMFENAKLFHEQGSEEYEDAIELQKEARALTEQEKAKPDDDFRDADGKLPLDNIEHGGELWRVGDWVHIRNPNDLSKPIVAQIYRMWSDKSGQKWVNACWFYRPEQTVHRYDKFFYENEVVKTGQYRDHRIEEIEDRCFVMFITRYPKGRPRGLPYNKMVYVCEARYNEEKCKFNKVKTWSSCLPEEVRDQDYEMDLWPVPRTMRKIPSPIKHLLQADAKETDDLPKPTWRSPNAPPLIGAVHRRPREPNESPPPEAHPTFIAPVPLAIGPGPGSGSSHRQSFSGGVPGTPTFHPSVAPAPGPGGHVAFGGQHYVQHFAPRQQQQQQPPPQGHGIAPHIVQIHGHPQSHPPPPIHQYQPQLQPHPHQGLHQQPLGPQHQHQPMPGMPMHVQPHHPGMPPMQPSPHYYPHQQPPSYSHQQPPPYHGPGPQHVPIPQPPHQPPPPPPQQQQLQQQQQQLHQPYQQIQYIHHGPPTTQSQLAPAPPPGPQYDPHHPHSRPVHAHPPPPPPPPPPPQQQQPFGVGPPHHPSVPIGLPVAHHSHSHPQPSPIAPNFPTPNRHHQPPPMGTPMQQHPPTMPQQLAPGSAAGNAYNAPRAPEVYTLAENIDSEIPEEVKKQFQTDDQGRVLFFTAPPLNRASVRNGGVAEQYAELGHSVHWESIKALKEERRRKRKERDEALQEEANKRKAAKTAEAKANGEGDEHKKALSLLEEGILQWCERMQKGTKHLEESLGGREEWEEMMRQSREENKGLTEAEIRKKSLRWWLEDQIKKGLVTEEERKQMEEAFLADAKGLTSVKATGLKA